ncbi:MAG: glycoside hydrolase family 15 protein [Candidatus Geothermarchaeales archaeon]
MIYGTDLQIMYGVEGERNLEERMLHHLAGYKNSRPVRIGNAAYTQRQIDVMGEVLHTMYLYFVHRNCADKLTDRQWWIIQHLVEFVIEHWREKDSGIWEFRGVKRHFTFSKVLAWVASDRGVRMAEHFNKRRGLPRWRQARLPYPRDRAIGVGWAQLWQSTSVPR